MIGKLKKTLFVIIYLTFFIGVEYSLAQKEQKINDLKSKILQTDNKIIKTKFYSEIVLVFSKNKNYDSAFFYVNKALDIIKNEQNLNQKIYLLNIKGRLFRLNNNYEKSIKILSKAHILAEKSENDSIICKILNNLGVAYRRIDDDANALKFHFQALKYARKSENDKNTAIALNSIGIIYTYDKKYPEAIELFEKSMEIERKNNNTKGIAINFNTIAWNYREQKKYNKAVEYYEKSLNLNIKMKDTFGLAICNKDIGITYQKMNENEKALYYFAKALEVFEKYNDRKNLMETQLYLGKLYYKIKKNNLSLKWTISACNYAESLKSKRLLSECYEQLSDTYQEIGYYTYAISYLRKAYKIKDEINNEKNNKIIKELEIGYESKKNKELIKILSEKNTLNKKVIIRQKIIVMFVFTIFILSIIFVFWMRKSRKKIRNANRLLAINNEKIKIQREKIKKQKQILEKSNASKDKFFSIIAHDLRNPFNILINLSEIIIENYNVFSEDRKQEIIKMINKSAISGHKLLENLLLWAKSQSKTIKMQYKIFDLREITKDIIVILHIKAINKNIKINNEIDENLKIYADVDMFKTIIRNLVSNALKFTRKNGSVTIKAKENPENIEISVTDTGIGIKPEKINKLFRIDTGYNRKGTADEFGSGLGLILVKEFVERHNGEIKVESISGTGSTFYILFPKN